MDHIKLLGLLARECESVEQGYWYSSGRDSESAALLVMAEVFTRVLRDLESEKEDR